MKMKMTILLISLFFIFSLFSLFSDAPSASTPPGHERMFVAYSDGTVSFINDTETQDVLWSLKTGRPICESYQASSNLSAYIDCGHDWNLYKHDRRRGTVRRVKTNDKIDDEMDVFVRFGVAVSSGIRTDVIIVDAHTGYVLLTKGVSDMPQDEERPKVERDKIRDKFVIIRDDYVLGVKTMRHNNVLWNVRVTEFMVQSHTSPGLTTSRQMHYMPIHRVHIADSDV